MKEMQVTEMRCLRSKGGEKRRIEDIRCELRSLEAIELVRWVMKRREPGKRTNGWIVCGMVIKWWSWTKLTTELNEESCRDDPLERINEMSMKLVKNTY